MDKPSTGKIDLQTAADALGVHYQTAYRWVRNGRLEAEMIGGRYMVSQGDVELLDQKRHLPKTPPAPRPVRLEHAADRMHEALLSGDETAAMKLACRLVDEGAPLLDVMHEVLVPPMGRIGEAWSSGEVTIWAEHRASAIVERILGAIAPNPRGRRRGTAMVAAVAGDLHSLPTTMAAYALRADNWHVHHLGADLPPEQIEGFCREHDVTLAVITVTGSTSTKLAEQTAARLTAAGTNVALGGAGRTLHDLLEVARKAT